MASTWKQSYLRYKSYFLNVYNIYKRRPDLKMFLEILLSIVTIAIFATFALRPTALTIVQLLEEIEAKEETIATMDEKIENLQRAQSVYEQELNRIALLDSSVPEDPDPELFVRQIEGLANRHSITILGMTVGEAVLLGEEEQEKRTAQELTPLPQDAGGLSFSVSVTGDYQNLDSFLSDLERLRRPVKIDSTTLNSSDREEGLTIVLVVGARVPYLKEGGGQ